jgi:hypothetical protein
MPSRTPPRYVPTLTHVVAPGAQPGPPEEAPRTAPALSQEQLVERLMRRVDITLERRLREAIAATVIEQTRSLGPILRDEIEAVVRQAVAEAFQEELPGHQNPPREPR